MATSKELFDAVRKQGWVAQGSVLDRVDNVLDNARINADDSVYGDKSATEDQYEQIFVASIQCILSSQNDKAVAKWFAKNGVTY